MRYVAQETVTIKAGTTGNKKYVANWESEEKETDTGLFDLSGNQIYTWKQLEDMGMNIEQDFSSYSQKGSLSRILRDQAIGGNLIIPSTVSKIGKYQVAYTSINNVTIPASVKEIGDYTFWNCKSLKTANIKSDILSYNMFSGCNNLKTVSLNGSISNIPASCFNNCSSLEQVVIAKPNDLTSIDTYAFYGDKNLLLNETGFDLQKCVNLKNIGDSAFSCYNQNIYDNTDLVITSDFNIGKDAFTGHRFNQMILNNDIEYKTSFGAKASTLIVNSGTIPSTFKTVGYSKLIQHDGAIDNSLIDGNIYEYYGGKVFSTGVGVSNNTNTRIYLYNNPESDILGRYDNRTLKLLYIGKNVTRIPKSQMYLSGQNLTATIEFENANYKLKFEDRDTVLTSKDFSQLPPDGRITVNQFKQSNYVYIIGYGDLVIEYL